PAQFGFISSLSPAPNFLVSTPSTTVSSGGTETGPCECTPPTNVSITSSSGIGCQPNTIYTGYGSQSITLTANATDAVSYLWSTGETAQSISVSIAGVYSVTAFDANGCSSVQ